MRETITKYKEKQEIEEEDYLECKYCGGKAIIEGTWAKARVRCLTCGIERPASEYEEEIEKLKEKWICELNES